jgi:ABC-type sugar transport system ATPase subunit
MIEIVDLVVRQGSFTLPTFSLRVEAGQYAVLMGKTGSGKTTILEAVCGLRKIASGRIIIDGVDVTRWSPSDRNIGYMPQDLALFPSMNVRQHLEFALKLRRAPIAKRTERLRFLLDMLGLESLLSRKVSGLSGGEAQRVALGRALSFGPSILLLDEPLSALDAETRSTAQTMLKKINQQTGVTVLHVTHDQDEADSLSDSCIRIPTPDASRKPSVIS